MSRSSAKELRVFLSPNQAVLMQISHAFTWRGRQSRVLSRHAEPCRTEEGVPPWHGALRTLEIALHEFAGTRLSATVILSNRLLRYALVPWRAELTDEAEEIAYARHCFTKTFGAAAQDWELRLSRDMRRSDRLASAVDMELLDGLREGFEKKGLTIQSIQPYLMMVVNSVKKHLHGSNAWFALFENDYLSLALLRKGRWASIRSQRVGGDKLGDLVLALERERFLSDTAAEISDVFMWVPGQAGAATVLPEPWLSHVLVPGRAAAKGTVVPFAMAVEGLD